MIDAMSVLDHYFVLFAKGLLFPSVRIQRHPVAIQDNPCRLTWIDFPVNKKGGAGKTSDE